MTNFFKKLLHKPQKKRETLYVDIHSHLIPGIDDGSKTMYESIKLIKAFKAMGYKKLITTPHTMWHRYKNSREIILEKLEYLKDALADHEIDIELEAASEYYLDEHFSALIKRKEILTFNGNCVLFEMSYTRAPNNLWDIIFELETSGYRPVLAHPERYLFMHDDFEEYEALKEHGVLFQLNINSLAGQYSKNVQKVAHKLADEGMVDFLGSDVHKLSQTETLAKMLHSDRLQRVFEKNNILNNTLL
ncbi:tyrosine-protein phosphatase [Hydrogenimonas cancrithermarum]|uniref:protein-tyrosine-phosphatase n=1 Tax=Hydrogenimonas cancrithermarum TaxID=2993563 RepID=A0ABN6WYX8_9BACT|nr:CpsB/CapC family capsule biosynthesis tyrosine phosphatase [Hydrogenimonas cancrithermarum]BDY13529.1 capsular polysaccharide biosynthesis protein [Hydrogenimonas cancrithermarum]